MKIVVNNKEYVVRSFDERRTHGLVQRADGVPVLGWSADGDSIHAISFPFREWRGQGLEYVLTKALMEVGHG